MMLHAKNFFNFCCFIMLLAVLAAPIQGQFSNADCITCHGDKELEAETPRGKTLNLYVPDNALAGSVHESFACTDCHREAASFEDVPHTQKPMKVNCSNCHEEVNKLFFNQDVHGRSVKNGSTQAPDCQGCHGGHHILPLNSAESVMSRANQPAICGGCHNTEQIYKVGGITKRNLISRYESSVHWEAIRTGKEGASCVDCHSHHNILSSAEENSAVSRTRVGNTCMKCHPTESRSFWDGAHGNALFYGNNDVPTCTTCHGDHDMTSLRVRVGDATQWTETQVCIWCHGNKRMMARYGLDTTPVESYMKDFHGLTQRGTMGASATCADCHDAHHSLPSSHPSSRMYISNRGTTCGKCHGNVSQSFALSFSHQKAMKHSGAKLENIVKIVYIWIIILTIGGIVLHNLIVWYWALRIKMKKQKREKAITRMTRFDRSLHFLLLFSFAVLVVTGFALKFPEAFWARWLFDLGMNETIRGFIHRAAAVVLICDSILFVFFVISRQRGKHVLKELLPRKSDLSEVKLTLKYYLGAEKDKPKFGMFNYGEKFEFWALVWGTVIMVVTGFVLWFPKLITSGMPSWIIGVSRIIHYYEALLATLAILLFHLYFTMFHPDEYPMNPSWLTGKILEKDAEHHFKQEAIETMKNIQEKDST